MKERIWLSLAQMGGKEQEFIKEAFDTNWVVPLGPNVNGFEQDLKAYLSAPETAARQAQAPHPPKGNSVEGWNGSVVALSAGTAALHLGLVMLGVKRDDEVICQSFTFSASANPITYQGATPVFIDSEPDTWNMDPRALRQAIEDRIAKTGRKPKAIIPVHLYGMPAKMNEILTIAREYDIPVLEDAAEAIGSEYCGRRCGTFGQFGALSFNGNKMITTSGGGALVCPDAEAAGRVMFYATQARDQAPHYQHSQIGYNYRLSNVCAGIGRGQMMVVDEHIARRRAIHALYTELLREVPGVRVQQNPAEDFNSNFWLTCIVVDAAKAGFDREQLRLRLEEENIESRPLWKPMHLQPVFAHCPYYGGRVAEELFNDGLCLPSGSSLSDEDIRRVVSVITAMSK